VPHGHWKTTTFTAGLRHDRIAAPMVLDGPMNGDAFSRLRRTFAKLKTLLRAAAARTIPDLWQAIADALRRFTPQECANYLAAAGYDAT
jgi:hypothetical protein